MIRRLFTRLYDILATADALDASLGSDIYPEDDE